MSDIAGRADIERLLTAFYDVALRDEVLGPVFDAAGMDLATHLPRIVGFWERGLLGSGVYTGRPMQVHQRLADEAGLLPEYFERWLVLWRQTVTELFDGPVAELAMAQAVRASVGMRRAIWAAAVP